MFQTDIGPLDGDKWESLIQVIYKNRYDSYQDMIASPGDLGIEGFVLDEGIVIQCYCPDENYDTKTLHEKQRDKITKDIGKLFSNQENLRKHIGDTKISQWVFITPRIAKHDIYTHARTKESEVKSANLDIIADDFKILIKDLGFYIHDIRNLQIINGEQLNFSYFNGEELSEPKLDTVYDDNIHNKNKIRSIIKK